MLKIYHSTVQQNCGDPGIVANAQRSFVSSTVVGATVTYTCNPGYQIQGSGQIICQSNGFWTTRPSCVSTGVQPGSQIYAIGTHTHLIHTNDGKMFTHNFCLCSSDMH